jgi:hypothetical protein
MPGEHGFSIRGQRARNANAARVSRLVAAGLVLSLPGRASAGPDSSSVAGPDRFDLFVRGETHAELFRRALRPGPDGTLVVTRTLLPIQEYVFLGAKNLDAPWRKDSIDVELSAWGATTLGDPSPERALDGDVQTANVGYRQGPLWVRLGRQHVAGGAARYARFDGADAGVALGAGLDVETYGGFVVLPRWDRTPGYYLLGAAAETALKDPNAVAAPPRSSTWLAGGRVGYKNDWARAGLSFHEEHTGGSLARRNLGADAEADLLDAMTVTGSALLDLDERRFADAHLSADVSPMGALDVTAEYLHAAPALLLSRQSVLSVFSTDSYDEVGGYATFRAARALRVESSGFVDVYDGGRPGGRGQIAARVLPDPSGRTVTRIEYTRLLAPGNGYHAIRVSLSRRFDPALSGTLEAYGYFYDSAIRNVSTSSVYAGTLTWQPERSLSFLIGGSLARSPYARLDAEAQLRVAYAFDLSRDGITR